MDPRGGTGDLVVVCDRSDDDALKMREYLCSCGMEARWYALRDLDEVDREVREGRVQRAMFSRWRDLLESIWNGEVNYDRWLSAGVGVEFIESPGESAAACLALVSRCWNDYARTRRRRNAIAGAILSLIALLAAFVVISL